PEIFVFFFRLHLRPIEAEGGRGNAFKRRRCFSRRPGARLWLGKALYRRIVPLLPEGLQLRNPNCPFPQRIWAAGNLCRRQGKSSGGNLPQGRSARGWGGD